jgi:membrane protein
MLARIADREKSASPTLAQTGVRPRLQRRADAIKERFSGSTGGHLWGRLNQMDFINRAMLFAAVLLLCFFPFLIVLNALAGRSAVTTLSRRLGLNHQAAVDVSHLFAS